MSSRQQVFAQGIRIFPPNNKAPKWVKGQVLINKKELSDWLRNQPDEIRLDIKESKDGDKWYTSVNTFEPKAQPPMNQGMHDDLPF